MLYEAMKRTNFERKFSASLYVFNVITECLKLMHESNARLGRSGPQPESPYDAQEEVLRIASKLGINISVGLAYQSSVSEIGVDNKLKDIDDDVSVYLGAAPIVECLERHTPDVLITSRVADASLFLGPMVFELGWNWDDLQLLAQGSLAGHLLECGCQLTGGYYMHPGDRHWKMTFSESSRTVVEVAFDGTVCVAKAEGTGGVLDSSTCAEQLLYEIRDPSSYITPDLIVNFQDVTFQPLSDSKVLCCGAKPSAESLPKKLLLLRSKDCGWRGWGEISYGGYESVECAKAAEFLIRAWMEELYPGLSTNVTSYIIGLDSLKAMCINNALSKHCEDIRLRMDGLFEKEEHAIQFTKEFTALYTNGPAGGGGIRCIFCIFLAFRPVALFVSFFSLIDHLDPFPVLAFSLGPLSRACLFTWSPFLCLLVHLVPFPVPAC
ncbi:hypothetical protein ACS0TY_000469 [Phlomoides rotata]